MAFNDVMILVALALGAEARNALLDPSQKIVLPDETWARSLEGGAVAKQPAAAHVQGHVLVAKAKPVIAAEAAKGFYELPGFSGPTPTKFLIVFFGKRVGEAVDIWTDVQAEMGKVIANVHGE